MTDRPINIGGASGFWGDAARSTPQLLAENKMDFIVYDYLAEITMSIMARARAKDPEQGYALDFVTVAMGKNLPEIERQGVKIISNAGGVNPAACATALRKLIAKQGLSLTVACVLGDDLLDQAKVLADSAPTEMFNGSAFPDPEKLQSVNAYLGAFPIAQALDMGADIVITGRSVDSAVTLGACIHSFDWKPEDFDQLAMGSLAGHILECGPQATGGNFTDWRLAIDELENIAYPYAEIQPDGSFICTKPENTGGLVSVGTVAEQLVYEIGDPQAYLLPDVSCDFSQVSLTQIAEDRVAVEGATGRPASDTYKVCATVSDGFRGGTTLSFYGFDADQKAKAFAEAVLRAARNSFAQFNLEDFTDTSIEVIGAGSQYGNYAQQHDFREVAVKIAAKHSDMMGVGIMLKEIAGLGLATPPGLSGFQGARAKPSPVVRLFSFVLPKEQVTIRIDLNDQQIEFQPRPVEPKLEQVVVTRPAPPQIGKLEETIDIPLIQLAWGRSGDKGNKANIGIIARQAEYYPYIVAALTTDVVAQRFAHFIEHDTALGNHAEVPIEAYLLPGINAINFLIHEVLGGGGVASIRNDAQGKGYAQILLEAPIAIPASLLVA